MKILGITVEYNPFHNGHKYHLEESMAATGADYSVAVMSGSFTQRGEPAVLDKWSRSRLAVQNGVDLVLELPFVFACSKAESFASGAVDILKGFGATHISFGSESGKLDELSGLVYDMNRKRNDIDFIRQQEMKRGISYAKALQIAVHNVLGNDGAALMTEPNNILAIEYLKRILFWKEWGYDIIPYTVKRFGSGYKEHNKESGFAGASVLRNIIAEKSANIDELQLYMPVDAANELINAQKPQQAEEKAFLLLKSELIKNSSRELSRIYCMGEGLENKFKKEIVRADSMQDFISSVISKRYTEAMVRRLIVYTLMGIKEYQPATQLYARVLAAGEKGRELLKIVKKRELSSIPVITNVNKQNDICETVGETLKYDILSSDLYNIIKGRALYDFSDRVVKPYML